ncbi:PocR ligand-binding domain-containing protein [Anaerosacchariphilus polymeriproducens]|nr:PocR ligand-binding domain-containing protein [Anaerosacchariphilus polymeriproducens]
MITLKNGEIDLTQLNVEDIIDVNVLQSFLDNFALGMNCAAVSVDRDGKEITKPSYYREFCQNYIHRSPVGDKGCAVCHNKMGEESAKIGRPFIGPCHAGLIDFAAPIIVKGELLGTVLGGQILDKNPNETNIRKVANELNLPGDELWSAAQKIDIVQKKNIEAAAEVLFIVVNALAQTGYNRVENELLSTSLAENFMQISTTVDILAESAQNITTSQHELSTEINEINNVTRQISQVLVDITKVADQTKLIGINASIEAARLGNDGRGFTVVANRIQNLSESTKKTAQLINSLNAQIFDKLDTTIKSSSSTLAITEDQSAAMEELSATVQNSVDLAEKLKKIFEM